ncbi:94_t:CDS:2 [Funneliformis caledonium]|uniref:94_t:CDS:1 n=1 Tax=Funneliformis caledonium TaxID=1117310 RepID=A0A9N9BTC9_9GLOM|nr:94_t:CDS:2 [Funneliformis caledonium]
MSIWVDISKLEDTVDSNNKDLFFAVLGESPGNFRVLTYVMLNVLRDNNHLNSRDLKVLCLYTQKRFMKLLDIMVKMGDNKNFPADYDYCILVMIDQPYLTTSKSTYNQRFNFREIDLTDLIVKQQEDGIFLIIIFIHKNKEDDYDKELVEIILNHLDLTSMSVLTSDWIIPIERKFNLLYINLELNLSAQFQYFVISKIPDKLELPEEELGDELLEEPRELVLDSLIKLASDSLDTLS